MIDKDQLLNEFRLFNTGNEGIESWISSGSTEFILDRIRTIDEKPITKVQLNQLLV